MRPRAVEPVEPALAAVVEPLVEQGRWQELRTLLAERFEDPRELPAGVALLYAIAMKEAPAQDEDDKPMLPETLGIRAVSQLLAVPEQSALSIVIAKRALRQRPAEWIPKRSGWNYTLLAIAALLVGVAVGWALHPTVLGALGK
jgi:hypothetical protein